MKRFIKDLGSLDGESFLLEAASGFEPENNGFADRRLTTWLCRLLERETGFEPATSTLARLHSTAELFPLSYYKNYKILKLLSIYSQFKN